MNHSIALYLIYLLLSIGATVWVARTLSSNGQIFLVAIFRGDAPLATAVNRLLVVGFYLLNVGYIANTLYSGLVVDQWQQVIEVLSQKIGAVLMVLAGIHFFNMFILFRMRRRSGVAIRPLVPPADPVVAPASSTRERPS